MENHNLKYGGFPAISKTELSETEKRDWLRNYVRTYLERDIELEHGYIAIEIKKSSKIRAVDARHLRNIQEILDKPVIHKILISNDLSSQVLDRGILAISAVKFLS